MKQSRQLHLLVAILILMLLSACAAPAPTASNADTSTAGGESQTTSITIWSRDTPDSVVGRAFAADIAAFQELHPELAIDYLSIPHSDVVTKWNTAFTGGIGPDVMDIGVSHVVQRVQLEQIVPLDDYYESWGEKDNLASGMVDYGRYDDHIYALAYNASPSVFAWRKDYFEAAGLDPERPPANWAEMLEYAEKLTVMEGDTMVRAGVELPDTRGANILFQFFLQNDTYGVDFENDNPNFMAPEVVEAGDFLDALKDYAMLNSAGGTGVFLSGNSAMTLQIGVDTLKSMIEENPDLADKIGVTPSLTNKKGGIHSGAWLYSISSQADDPDLAWEFITFVLSEERSRARMESVGMVPPLLSLREEYIALNPELHEAQLDNLVQSQAYPKLAWTNLYEETLHRAYEEIIYNQKEPAQALTDAETEILAKR